MGDNERRTADYNLLDAAIESRVTLTERSLLAELRNGLSEITDHYVLTDEERSWVEGVLTAPPRRDAVEEVLAQVYRACALMRRGWHGKRRPEAVVRSEWIVELAGRALDLRRSRLPSDFREAAVDLAAACVYAVIWSKDER